MKHLSIITLLFSFLSVVNAQTIKTITEIDKEMASAKLTSTIKWIDAKTLTLEGVGWQTGIADYTRIPDKYKLVVTPNVWSLSRHSSGIAIHFKVKGTSFIDAKWILGGYSRMTHMTSLGANGLDLYAKINGEWIWIGVGKPIDGLIQEAVLRNGLSPDKSYECKLYLPLYTSPRSLQIGFSSEAEVTPARNLYKPIVFYGTSITQGCSASRPGMSYTSQVGRRFDYPVINLGFSGNGLMEAHFAPILADIDASIYVIDCLGNMGSMSPQEVKDRTSTLVRKLRSLRPDVPIVLMEDRLRGYIDLIGNAPIPDSRAILRKALKECYEVLSKEMKNIYYIEEHLLSSHGIESLVDGGHPSDIGMYDYFVGIEPTLSNILQVKSRYKKK